jgi:hydrogenase small subunit
MADETIGARLQQQGISRRTFLKFCTALTSAMALPPTFAAEMADKLAKTERPSVLWYSLQDCTGCVESLSRADVNTLEHLIFDVISLDYQHTLMAASGTAAEAARDRVIKEKRGKYVIVMDGSIPMGNPGYGTIAGQSFHDWLIDSANNAAAIIALGTCASFGGIPKANPNPTGSVPISDLVKNKPIINVPGCPPIPVVISGVLAHYLTFGTVPELDDKLRPVAFFGETIHDRCYRRPFYDQGKFAKTFDDEGARNGWCLYELGCKGPTTYNACATAKWNEGTSFPIEAGHGCIGCAAPDFWDRGSFYEPLAGGTWSQGGAIAGAAAVGVAIGVGAAAVSRHRQRKLTEGK